MALQCTSSLIQPSQFEFIDCSTININYNVRGIATISFSIITTEESLLNDYTNLTFGGVDFSDLVITSVQVQRIPGTLVRTFNMNMTGFGC